jgi:ABC-type lipoprotein release transport system permease subunit
MDMEVTLLENAGYFYHMIRRRICSPAGGLKASGYHHWAVAAALIAFVIAAGAGLVPAVAQEDAAPTLMSRQLAEEQQIRIGDVVQLAVDAGGTNTRPFRIVGIYEPTPDPMRLGTVPREVRLHLPDLLSLTRDPAIPAGTEHVEAINVALANPEDAESFARDVNARMPGVVARATGAVAGPDNPFLVIERFHLAIAAVTIIAATVFLLALTIMLVDERRETVGVLRLIGLPARRILTQIFLEGILIAGVGALFGLVLAVASEGLINRFFQWRYDTALIFVRITPDVALLCVAIAVPLGAVATVVASWALLRRGALRLARR